MTDEAAATAATAVTGADASATATANGSAAVTASDPFAGLQNAESLEWIKSKGFKALDPVVESARYADKVKSEFEDFKGKALTLPPKDASPEVKNEFYAKIGRPDTPEGYEFPLPEGMPENLPWDGELDKAAKPWFFEAGATPEQAQFLRGKLAQYSAAQYNAQMEAVKAANIAAESAATDALSKDWGDPSSKIFQENVTYAKKFIMRNGGESKLAEWQAKGWFGEKGSILDPALGKALAIAGREYREDGGELATGGQVQAKRGVAETFYPPEKDPFRR